MAWGINTIPISSIKPGMMGIGKTVFKGTKIEDFHVKVIDVIEDEKGDAFIFVKLTDPIFSTYGSIVSGMSGSPIYFNGKLAGALAYGWKYTKGPYGLVVPIGIMMRVKREFFSLKELVSEASYLSVSGVGERAYQYLKKMFGRQDIKLFQTGIMKAKVNKNIDLKPGSAVSVDLSTGDLNISAIGTLTYRDKDFFLAFGHPILKKGNVDFLFSSAYIFGVVPNMEFPFKLGTPVSVVGKTTEDRQEAVAGYIGKFPKVISIIVRVCDIDRGVSKFFRVKSVQDEEIFPLVLLVSALEGIDQAINRIGKGTSKISISFNKGGKSLLEITDMFWSDTDIAAFSLSSLKELVYDLEDNPFESVKFDEVKINIDITKEKKVGYIEDITLDKDEYTPGELIRGEVKIRPYRKPPFIERVSIRIPDDFPFGTSYLLVRGGDVSLPETMEFSEEKPQNLDEFLKFLINREKNNSIVLELYTESFSKISKDKKDNKFLSIDEVFKKLQTKKVKRIFDTDMIIEDWVEKEIKITPKRE